MNLKTIGHVRTDFPSKFGIPRQSCLVEGLRGRIVFEERFRDPNFVRGLEQYSDIWLLWGFSQIPKDTFSPTVRPPRLGGNQRVGVFASRSPRRPNPIGLSRLKLERIEQTSDVGPVLHVCGVDMLDMSPVYDIKPYVWVDAHANAQTGFSASADPLLTVEDPDGILAQLSEADAELLRSLVAQDPRPAYHTDPDREYAMEYKCYTLHFRVRDAAARLTWLECR